MRWNSSKRPNRVYWKRPVVPVGGNAGEILLALARLAPVVLPTWVAMVLVVAFSSSLDVAAIEMELGRPLDYDRELKTVGFGNLLSGALGGFSGSYIFSQTIINMRSKVANRVSGLVVCVAELALVSDAAPDLEYFRWCLRVGETVSGFRCPSSVLESHEPCSIF